VDRGVSRDQKTSFFSDRRDVKSYLCLFTVTPYPENTWDEWHVGYCVEDFWPICFFLQAKVQDVCSRCFLVRVASVAADCRQRWDPGKSHNSFLCVCNELLTSNSEFYSYWLDSHGRGDPGSWTGRVMWHLWWATWYWCKFSRSTSVSPCESLQRLLDIHHHTELLIRKNSPTYNTVR
jgi:hypothetical protein